MAKTFNGFEAPGWDSIVLAPRSFFTTVIATEPTEVIRVVAYLLLKALDAQQQGLVSSQDEITRAVGGCRAVLHQALQQAVAAGYLQVVSPDGQQPGGYLLNWATTIIPDYQPKRGKGRATPITTTPARQSNIPALNTTAQQYPLPFLSVQLEAAPPPTSQVIPAPGAPATPYSEYLVKVCATISQEFDDPSPNSSRTQTLNLWRDSGLSEQEFARLMEQASLITRQRVTKPAPKPALPPGTSRNPVAYFFGTLRGLLSSATNFSPKERDKLLSLPAPPPPDSNSPPHCWCQEAGEPVPAAGCPLSKAKAKTGSGARG
jgi:hypothetical protein